MTNVVLILTDDMGEWAFGFLNEEIHTPRIDEMAAGGTVFRNFFCTSPVCSPARASLLTGLIPSQHGVLDYVLAGNSGTGAVPYLQAGSAFTNELSAAGYRCGLSGKWHLGDSLTPQQGFSHWYAHESSGGPYVGAKMVRDGRLVIEPEYVTRAIADDAIDFIGRAASDGVPFFSYVSFTAPHAPWVDQHPAQYTDLYADAAFASCPQEPAHPWLRPLGPNIRRAIQEPRESLVGYFAAVTAMDVEVGRILDSLARLGLAEDTLVMFVTDNGFNAGHHGIWGKGNGTYPATVYDTSVRTPAVFHHPGAVPGGVVREELISAYDVRSTLLEYLDVEDSEQRPGPGTSFRSLLAGAPSDDAEFVVVFDEYGSTRMIRTPEWKYVSRPSNEGDELFDLVSDPGERENRVGEPGAVAVTKELRAALEGWFGTHASPVFDARGQQVHGTGQLRPIRGPADDGAFQGPEDPFV